MKRISAIPALYSIVCLFMVSQLTGFTPLKNQTEENNQDQSPFFFFQPEPDPTAKTDANVQQPSGPATVQAQAPVSQPNAPQVLPQPNQLPAQNQAVAQAQPPANLPTVNVPTIPMHASAATPIKPGPLMIMGCFTIPESYDKLPLFRVYFEGKEAMSDNEGLFSLPLDEDTLEKFTFVISKTVQQKFDKHNTLKSFNIIPDKNYLCYSFKKRGSFGGAWVQRPKDLQKKHFVLPENALVVLLDPKYVDHLEPWNVNLANNFIKLPKIVLKPEVKSKSVERASAKGLLNALDAGLFHEAVREVAQVSPNNPKIKITAPQ